MFKNKSNYRLSFKNNLLNIIILRIYILIFGILVPISFQKQILSDTK